MSFSVDLKRNANVANRMNGRYPLGDEPAAVVEIHIFYGQSNTFGPYSFESGAVDDAVNYDSLRIRMLDATYSNLVTAAELVSNTAMLTWANLTEDDTSGLISYANYMLDRQTQAGNPTYDQVVLLNGKPSSTVAQISQGTQPFTDWENQFTAAVNLIIAEGKTPHVSYINYSQGETDILQGIEANWADRLDTGVYQPMDTIIKSLTGQLDSPKMHVNVISSMYTTNENELALEMQRANSVNSNIKVTAYSGFAEHHTDAQHYSGGGQRYMMQQNAKFSYYDTLEALTASSAAVVGSTIEIQCAGGFGDLQEVLPVGMVSAPTDYNIRVFDNGVTPVAVTGVTLDNINRRVVCTLADGGAGSNYTIDGSYYTDNAANPSNTGGQFNSGRVPIADTDTRKGQLSDSVNHGNPELYNPLMPFRITGVN